MDETVRHALAQGGTIDITTTGRKTGAPRRIEIAFASVGWAILSAILRRFAERSGRAYDLDDWVAHSPLVSVTIDE